MIKIFDVFKKTFVNCNRQYVEFYHEELEPYVHFVPVEEDLSDLLEKTKWLITHPIESKNIAINMFKFAVNRFKQKKLLEKVNTVFNKNFL